MSLAIKRKEIERLISAFEREADKFHDLKFSTFFVTPEGASDNRKFEHPNHTIMLWQYYGNLTPKTGVTKLIGNFKDSDLKWGLRGSELSSCAVLEGKACKLFVRMAKRAGNLFDEKESAIIKSRVVGEIQKSKADGISKPVAITNDNVLAIWLNYLLYYISKINPGREQITRIEPDPFSLSLMALENLLKEPIIEKIDKSLKKLEGIKFKVALSFPGEKRKYVSKVADYLRIEFGNDQVFYDFDYQSQLAKPDLDTLLQNIYRKNSELIVVFLSREYSQKQWCGLEWRSIRDIIKNKENDKIMFIRFDNADIDGFLSIDGYIDANTFNENQVAELIKERVALLAATH